MSWPDGSDHYYQIFERMAMSEAEVIEGLASLCRKLISELSQYTDMAAAEARLQEILGETDNGLEHGNHRNDNERGDHGGSGADQVLREAP